MSDKQSRARLALLVFGLVFAFSLNALALPETMDHYVDSKPFCDFSGSSLLANNTWVSKTPMPAGARSGLGMAAGINAVYVIGGGQGTAYYNRTEAYSPSNNTWWNCMPMPTERAGVAVATVNDLIYAIGGYTTSRTSTVEVYCPANNTWWAEASLPAPRGCAGVTVINDIIYVAGGIDAANSPLSSALAYNPANSTWWAIAPLKTDRIWPAISAYNGLVYAIGGQATPGGTILSTIEIYSPVNNTWWYGKSIPLQRYAASAVTLNGTIYAIGGRITETPSGDDTETVYAYSPANNTWWKVASMPTARGWLSAAVLGGKIYAAGGYHVGATYDVNEEYTPSNLSAITVPSEPLSLAATPGDTQVTLDWTAPLSDGGSPVTNYRIYRGTASGAATFLTEIGNVLTHTDTGLTNGVKYYYNITAKNTVGEGATSTEVSATPAPGPSVPSAPQNLAATASGTTVTLTWQTPASDGGSSITNYRIYRGIVSGAESFLCLVGNVLTYDNTGLTIGVTYYYNLTAVNNIGEGSSSSEVSAMPQVTGPGWLTGRVINMRTIDGLPGATVKVNETGDTGTTNATGYYNITLPVGTYNLTATKTGFLTEYRSNVDIMEAYESYESFFLSPPKGALAGKVTDKATGKPIQYASVTPTGYYIGAITDASGNYSIIDMYVGAYIVNVSWIFYKNASKPATILEGQTTVLNFELEGEDILTKAIILGVVTDYKTGNPISGVLVKVGSVSTTTGPYGNYNLTVEPGSVTIKFSKAGYNDASTTENLNAGDMLTVNVKMVPSGGGFDMLWILLIIIIVVVIIAVVAVAMRKKKQPPATACPAAPYYPYQHPSPGTQEQAQMAATPTPIVVPIPLKETLATGQLSIIEQKIIDMIREHPGADPRWLARVLDLRIDNLQTHIRGLTNAGYITVLQSSDKDDLGYYIKGTEPESVLASQQKGQ
jgi:hypothetical protein